MKSGISFFNRTVFLKNVTLFWPVWGCYLLFLLLSGPGLLWLDYMSYKKEDVWWVEGQKAFQLTYLAGRLDFGLLLAGVCVMACVTGMLLFHYLNTAKSAYMIHAFPLTRGELYGTNVLTGLCFMAVPQILTFFVGMAVCLAFGMTHVEYLAVYLLLQLGADILMYGIGVLSAMVSGQMFAVPLFFAAFNLLCFAVRLLIQSLFVMFCYGIDDIADGSAPSDILSPLIYLADRVEILPAYQNGQASGIVFQNASCIAWYLIPAAALYVLGYFLYRRRHLETAGDLVAVGFLRPLFRWGVAFFAAYLMGIFFDSVAYAVGQYSLPFIVAGGMAGGVLCFYLAQMLLEKNFRVFRARTAKECGAWCACMLAGFFFLRWLAGVQENYIPEQGDVRKVAVSCGMQMELEEEQFAKVLDMHREILGYAGRFHSGGFGSEEGFYVNIAYTLLRGRTVKRSYYVPAEFAERESFMFFRENEEDPEWFLSHRFLLSEGNYEKYLERIALHTWDDEWGNNQTEIYVKGGKDSQIAQDIYDAIFADAREGSLQKYNLTWRPQKEDDLAEMYSADLVVTLCIPAKEIDRVNPNSYQSQQMYQQDDGTYIYENPIALGPDCTHILGRLEKYGVISSADDLYGLEDQ